MGVRVKLALAVPDLAGALQDDPAGRGQLVNALDVHLPQDAALNGRLHDFLTAFAARAGVLL